MQQQQQLQQAISPKTADDSVNDKSSNRAGVPYCAVCKSLVACDEKHEYTHSGWLQRKKSKFHLKTNRYFVVVDRHVLYYSDSSEVGRVLPSGVLHLTQGSVHDGGIGDKSHTFYISGVGHEPLKLEANSESEKRQWLTILTSQISSPPQERLLTALSQAHFRICTQCSECISLDSFTLGSHVGWLTKQGGDIKTWKKRWVVVAKTHVCYYHSPDDVASFKPIKILHVVSAVRCDQGSKPFMFTIDSGARTFYFVCDNEQDHKEWLEALQIK